MAELVEDREARCRRCCAGRDDGDDLSARDHHERARARRRANDRELARHGVARHQRRPRRIDVERDAVVVVPAIDAGGHLGDGRLGSAVQRHQHLARRATEAGLRDGISRRRQRCVCGPARRHAARGRHRTVALDHERRRETEQRESPIGELGVRQRALRNRDGGGATREIRCCRRSKAGGVRGGERAHVGRQLGGELRLDAIERHLDLEQVAGRLAHDQPRVGVMPRRSSSAITSLRSLHTSRFLFGSRSRYAGWNVGIT